MVLDKKSSKTLVELYCEDYPDVIIEAIELKLIMADFSLPSNFSRKSRVKTEIGRRFNFAYVLNFSNERY